MATSNKGIISQSLANKILYCIKEYEAIKNKSSDRFKTVKDFCPYHRFSHYNFGLNVLKNMQNTAKKVNKNKIIMSRSGELLHIDLHHLASSITIVNNNKPFYLLGLLDGYSRIAWVEVYSKIRFFG